MMSPYEVAIEFNKQITRASSSDYSMDERIVSLELAAILYYVLFGVALNKSNTTGYFNYGTFVIDARQYDRQEVDNQTGTRYNRPIRRFLSSMFLNKY